MAGVKLDVGYMMEHLSPSQIGAVLSGLAEVVAQQAANEQARLRAAVRIERSDWAWMLR